MAETTELLAQRFDHILYTGQQPRRPHRDARRGRAPHAGHARARRQEPGHRQPPRRTSTSPPGASPGASSSTPARPASRPTTCWSSEPVHDQLVDRARRAASPTFYGDDPQASADYTRIVNEPHFHRLEKLLHSGTVAVGGQSDADTRYIAPTVLTGITRDDPVMARGDLRPDPAGHRRRLARRGHRVRERGSARATSRWRSTRSARATTRTTGCSPAPPAAAPA